VCSAEEIKTQTQTHRKKNNGHSNRCLSVPDYFVLHYRIISEKKLFIIQRHP